MNNKYLVIKLPGNWIEREQLKERVRMFLGSAFILDNTDVITLKSSEAVLNESRGEVKKFTKEKIAVDIGRRLLDIGALSFEESNGGSFPFTTKIEGTITVIREQRGEKP